MAVRNGKLALTRKVTVRQAADEWFADAERGVVTTRSGDRYKPSAIRSYRQSLRLRLLDELGDRQFSQVARGDLQRLVDGLVADGLSPSTVQFAAAAARDVPPRDLAR